MQFTECMLNVRYKKCIVLRNSSWNTERYKLNFQNSSLFLTINIPLWLFAENNTKNTSKSNVCWNLIKNIFNSSVVFSYIKDDNKIGKKTFLKVITVYNRSHHCLHSWNLLRFWTILWKKSFSLKTIERVKDWIKIY